MIDEKTLQISNKSYINKDFQTIYPELVDIVKKLTDKWNPEATNESDPLVVLLKLMAFVADKENYNIDKNVLESFLPSATQETSFRNITEMQGYTMKYYESASTNISVMYSGEELDNGRTIKLPPYTTTFTNEDNTVVYSLCDSLVLSQRGQTNVGKIIEGKFQDLTINGNTNIQLSNLDLNNRLYFPNQMIASNLVLVKNDGDFYDWNTWKQTTNLNGHVPLSRVFKFGYDSSKSLPYIEFPDDIGELIDGGLNVKYIISKGYQGNITPRTLTVLEGASDYHFDNGDSINVDYLYVNNMFAAINGKDKETLDEAYNNFRKTVGTFDVLVTTRDFANYLYNQYDTQTLSPLVSNIQVSDRRTDINFVTQITTITPEGEKVDYHKEAFKTAGTGAHGEITPFDLVLYPLMHVEVINENEAYDETYKSSDKLLTLIENLEDAQSIDHTYLSLHEVEFLDDTCTHPYLVKAMYNLNCKLITIEKVNQTEAFSIINNVKQELYNNFNARKVDYGKAIPYDSLLQVIQNADNRIKNVILDEPKLTTKYMSSNGKGVDSNLYKNMATMKAKNVLAGKVELFEYDNSFNFKYSQDNSDNDIINNISSLEPRLNLTLSANEEYTLKVNQEVELMCPNYSVDSTAVVGVNYNWNSTTLDGSVPHKLASGEVLKISTTTTNEGSQLTYTEVYDYNSIKRYRGDKEEDVLIFNKSVDENIIQSNFSLSSGGWKTLGTNESIDFLSKVEVVLDTPVKAYWFVNNADNVLFTQEYTEGGNYYRILDEGEYFFYADTTLTKVEVFGSGTKLTVPISSGINWQLSRNDLISVDTFTSSDIATFSTINWRNLNLSSLTKMTAEEQQIFTMGEDDKFSISSGADLDYTLQSLDDGAILNAILSDGTPYTLTQSSTTPWKIRTRLVIDSGPDRPQILKENESLIINEDTYELTGDNLLTFELSSLVQSASTIINLSNASLYQYVENKCQMVKDGQTEDIPLDTNGGFNVAVGGVSSIVLNFPNVSGDATCLVIYNNTKIGDAYQYQTTTPYTKNWNYEVFNVDSTVTSENFNEKKENLYIKENDEYVHLSASASYDVNETYYIKEHATEDIKPGVNCISIKDANTLTITINADSIGNIAFLPIRLANMSSDDIEYNDVLKLSSTFEEELTTFNAILKKYEETFNWFYNVPNAYAIDFDDFNNAAVYFEVNNLYNKFVLPEIDFDTSNISILRSSLLS